MSDKLKKGVSAMPAFVNGEIPTAAKFTSVGTQTQRAISNLEKAVGDIHDESYPYSSLNDARLSIAWGKRKSADTDLSSNTRMLGIANIARIIGSAANLNPAMPSWEVEVTEAVPSGVYEFTTRFPILSLTSSTDTAVVTSVANPSLLVSTGDYYKGLYSVFTFSVTSGGEITYTLNPALWGAGSAYTGSTFNIIPDPIQIEEGGDGCTVSGTPDGDGRHTISLPLCTHLAQNETKMNVELDDKDPMFEEQIVLPRVLTENYVAGEEIPSGFLYLKNWTTGKVYSEATYYYSDTNELLIGGVDLTTEVGDGDQFIIITVGTDIATILDDLRFKMSHHEHNGDFGESHIEASSIVGWTKQAGPNGPFTKSRVDGNFAPQYLHRDGFQSTDSGPNDRNIMRGNLVIGAENKLAGSNHNDFGPSFDIRFGTITGPSIKKNNLYELVISCTEGVKIVTNNDDALELETGLIETSSDVTGTTYSPPLDNVGNYATIDAGHSVRELGANVSDSFAAGPFSAEYGADALDAWDLELDNSDGYATHSSGATIFTSAWKTPRIQVLYLGQSNVHFDPLAYDAGTSPTWAATAIWQCDIPLPAYLANYGNANAGRKVLAVMPYVRGGNATSSWQGVGFENERGAAGYVYDQQGFRMSCQFTESGSSTPNVIRLRIAADGDAGANPFHYSHFQGGAASGDPATDAAIDIKVTMIVAAPTHTFSF